LKRTADAVLSSTIEYENQAVSSATDKAADPRHIHGTPTMNAHDTKIVKRVEHYAERKIDADVAVPDRDSGHVSVCMNRNDIVHLDDVHGCALSNGNPMVVQNRQTIRRSRHQCRRHRPPSRATAMTPPEQLQPDP
jgi:hypothetical protein